MTDCSTGRTLSQSGESALVGLYGEESLPDFVLEVSLRESPMVA
jgi:hypothetical protein